MLRIVTIACVLAAWASVATADEILWLTLDFPPTYIARGPLAGQGTMDKVLRVLQEKMPEYQHRQELSEPAAIMGRLRTGQKVCSASYLKTAERERVVAYSLPDMIGPPVGIALRRADLARFGGKGPVSLEGLLEQPDLKLGITYGRSYGPAVDAILRRFRTAGHVYSRQGKDIYPGLFEMLLKGKLDYVIGYVTESTYLARQHRVQDQIAALPLSELPDHMTAHVVCPKNEWGLRVIAKVNQVLREERPKPAYRAIIEHWLDPSFLPALRREYDRLLLGTK